MTKEESCFLAMFIFVLGATAVGVTGHYVSWLLGCANIAGAATIGIFGYIVGRLNS